MCGMKWDAKGKVSISSINFVVEIITIWFSRLLDMSKWHLEHH